MRQAGIWLPRAERKRIQQPRHRREHFGELIQIDGSDHRWFEDRAAPCTLLMFIDDACAYRKSSPSILVMQSTQDRTAQNAPRCLGGT
jgi:hypothetical protein